MKKLGTIFLTAALILTLCACGSGDASTGDDEIIESTDGPAAILTTDSSDNNTAEDGEPDSKEPDGDTPDTQDEAKENVSQEPEESDSEEDTPDEQDEPDEPDAPASSDAPVASTNPGIPAVTQPETQPEPEPDPEPSEPEPADEPEQNTPDPKSVAESYIDKSLSGLVAAIGQPNSSDYAPSCLGDGEDGELFYNGFTVYTYREGNEETVIYVE